MDRAALAADSVPHRSRHLSRRQGKSPPKSQERPGPHHQSRAPVGFRSSRTKRCSAVLGPGRFVIARVVAGAAHQDQAAEQLLSMVPSVQAEKLAHLEAELREVAR
jgi:hypothetical protein